MQLNPDSDEEILKKGLPYVRSFLAFAVFLRFGFGNSSIKDVSECYEYAGKFIAQLKKDLKDVK